MVSHAESDEVRNRLLDAAAALIEQGGRGSANISAIAQQAGVSRMTVYRKYPDRHAILSALFNRELGGIIARAAQVEAPTQKDRIVEAVARSVTDINAHPLMQAVLRHEPEELTEWITGHLGATQRLARTVLHEQIVQGQTGDHSIRAGDPDAMSLTIVLVAQSFVFAHQIGGSDEELRILVKGYLS
ncbi:MAG: TetR/AcrR family transcriptional regulator [Candidatus Nanopelagicales bacterium]